jgi:hypothetical protein
MAETVYVTGCVSNCSASAVCGSDPNSELNPTTWENIYSDVYGAFTSARVTTVPDKPPTPGARYFGASFTNTLPDAYQGMTLRPHLSVTGGVYRLYHIYNSAANNVSQDLIVGVTNISNCTLSFTETDKFQRKYGQPAPQKWQFLGYVTNDAASADPIITFFYKSGKVDSSPNRLVVDTFRFSDDLCLDIDPVGVTGPLDATAAGVVVTGVKDTATSITVYQNSGSGYVAIGTKTEGIAAGNNTVAVSGLIKGAAVGATQTVNGQEGCKPTAGIRVGGGPNPRLRMALSVREAVNATGPVGADGSPYTTNSSRIHHLGAATVMSGAGPADGLVLYPSNDWQTVTFMRGPDYTAPTNPSVIWNSSVTGQSGTQNDLQGEWGTIEAISFALDDNSDTGPYVIYIDNITNGGITNAPQVVEDFEAAPAKMVDYTFRAPSFSGTTSGFILSAPNDAVVDNLVADTGSKSLRVRFQWTMLVTQYGPPATNNWLRFTTSNTPRGHRNPLVNLNDPITLRIFMQPPGATPPLAPPAPLLSYERVGDLNTFNWVGAHRLQGSVDVSGGYTNLPQEIVWPNTNTFLGPYTNTSTDSPRFFRLVD